MVRSRPIVWWQVPGPRTRPSTRPSRSPPPRRSWSSRRRSPGSSVIGPRPGRPSCRPASLSVRRLGQVVLTDQRVGQQRPVDPVATTVQGRLDGQLLVPADVRDEAGQLGGERRGRARPAPSASTRQVTSMTASSGRNGRCPLLRTFAEWTSRCVAEQRGDQPDGRLGVERAAPLGRAGPASRPDAGSAYIVEQLVPRSRPPAAPASAAALLPYHLVVAVEVAQVVRGYAAQRGQDLGRERPPPSARSGQVVGQQLRAAGRHRPRRPPAPRSGG